MWFTEKGKKAGASKPKGRKREFPIRAADYELLEPIGDGATAVVRRARCLPHDGEIVAIKIMNMSQRTESDVINASEEVKTMIMTDHPNLLSAYCSFTEGETLWIVMPYMAGGSCYHLMKSSYPKGFKDESFIAFVLREALKGLEYLHENGHIHRDVKAGNILLDQEKGVKLSDFGVTASLYDSIINRHGKRKTLVGTPFELAIGHAPFSSQPPAKVFLMTLTHAPPSLNNTKEKKFTEEQETKLQAERKPHDKLKEKASQEEYIRGVSEWNFDIEDLRAQAARYSDEDEAEAVLRFVFEIDTVNETSSSQELQEQRCTKSDEKMSVCDEASGQSNSTSSMSLSQRLHHLILSEP
ncbi:hypothetical protein PR202_gb06403 [Eleusine coracana subsp. coracana]|uniref:Protein kinase domain-containing protein n=1 Tax=Eleusine coracana subsp. coracana TaxID=191504 RepID=A0AAV5E9I7_ELECO|nr:hypothetical protein PR202_gb06403 [Eleusine coracana subsp. coracana]